MNNHTDTRLTDYALGELDDAQRREVEQLLETDAEARRAVDDTAALALMLRASTPLGADVDAKADEALHSALVEHLGATGSASARLVTIANTGKGGGTRTRRTTIWAVAASIAVLLTSVGTIAMIGDSADEKASTSQAVLIIDPSSSRNAEQELAERLKNGLIFETRPIGSLSDRGGEGEEGAGQKSNAFPRDGLEFSSAGGESKSISYRSTAAAQPAPAPSPALPAGSTTFNGTARAQPLFSEIPKINTFNNVTGLSGNNSYSGGTVINGGITNAGTVQPTPSRPGLASQQPQGPVILNPTPQPNYPGSQPSVAEPQTGRFMLGVGANSNAGLLGSIVLTPPLDANAPHPAEGWFASADYLNWATNQPAKTTGGDPTQTQLGRTNWNFDAVRGPWDVDNDGDGMPDSIWVDLGAPIQTNADGRLVKPIFGIFPIDLEGRILAGYLPKLGPEKAELRSKVETRIKELEKIQNEQQERANTEAYDAIVENAFLKTTDEPLSTFSIDVDTASYSNVRRFLNDGQLPPKSAVRLEEFINYFTYDYSQPTGDEPFAVTTEAARCPWNGEHVLVRVGLKGKEIHRKERPATNLVFLVDVSGSMHDANKLPLVRESLKLLVNELGDSDRVAMVVYAGSSGLVLPSTGGDRKQTILEAIDRLQAGGSTNGASGITLAYQVAAENFIKGGVNRVVLATDGDFNVGVTNQGDLVTLIETKAKSGVFFSALGYGMGNLKDSTLEKLADKGNGNYAYIDTLAEARKVLVEQMSGTLVTIAKDVKVQIEFNPQRVAAYRLLGYENRMLAAQDFNDDKKDAGEVGAGHTVTALYELIPAGKSAEKETKKLPTVDPLKYQQPTEKNEPTDAAKAAELLTLKLRYKQPDGDVSKLIERPLADDVRSYAQASGDFKFASSVAAFGMMLRDSKYRGSATFDAVLELAQEGVGKDQGGYRAEFVELVRKAKALSPKK